MNGAPAACYDATLDGRSDAVAPKLRGKTILIVGWLCTWLYV